VTAGAIDALIDALIDGMDALRRLSPPARS